MKFFFLLVKSKYTAFASIEINENFPSTEIFLHRSNFGCPSLKLYNLVCSNAGSAFHYDNGLGEREYTTGHAAGKKKRPFEALPLCSRQYIAVCLVES